MPLQDLMIFHKLNLKELQGPYGSREKLVAAILHQRATTWDWERGFELRDNTPPRSRFHLLVQHG